MKECHAKTMTSKKIRKTLDYKLDKNPSCTVGLLERMKRGRGIKVLDDKSRGMEILMTESFNKINPTDPLIVVKQTAQAKTKLLQPAERRSVLVDRCTVDDNEDQVWSSNVLNLTGTCWVSTLDS